MIDAFHAIFTPFNIRYIFQGLGITLQVAVISILLSIVFGTILGLMRSYGNLVLRKLAGFYIEMFRNTPNLLWVFVCFIAAPFSSAVARCTMAYVLFTSAMMAEIVRGGLNSISKGQFEAAYSQGFGFFPTIWHIILPQTYRRIIPTMMSQIVTVVKDTSFMAQVAVAELLYNTKNLMATLYIYSGHPITTEEVILLFLFAMLIYFVVNFTISLIARYVHVRMQRSAEIR